MPRAADALNRICIDLQSDTKKEVIRHADGLNR